MLEQALDLPGGMAHPGLLHLYVHLMEMSAHPEQALGPADALRDAGPRRRPPAAHADAHRRALRRLPRVVAGNDAAIAADDRYAAHAGDVGFYTLYRAHDHHFRIYGAMFVGQRQVALEAAGALEAMLREELLRVEVPPMADWLEGFVPMRLHVLVRFGALGRADRHAAAGRPRALLRHHRDDPLRARASPTRRPPGSPRREAEREAFHAAVARVPESRYLFNNTCLDILAVAAAMLDGELAYREGNSRRGLRRTCAARSSSTTRCPTTSRGAGCSRPATPTARCCSSRARSSSPRPSTPPTSAWTPPSAAPASTRATSGACTATTSA